MVKEVWLIMIAGNRFEDKREELSKERRKKELFK